MSPSSSHCYSVVRFEPQLHFSGGLAREPTPGNPVVVQFESTVKSGTKHLSMSELPTTSPEARRTGWRRASTSDLACFHQLTYSVRCAATLAQNWSKICRLLEPQNQHPSLNKEFTLCR